MATKIKKGEVLVSESGTLVAVSVQETAAGSVDSSIKFFVYKPIDIRKDRPALRGEDYPSLVEAWDNKKDDIFDTV